MSANARIAKILQVIPVSGWELVSPGQDVEDVYFMALVESWLLGEPTEGDSGSKQNEKKRKRCYFVAPMILDDDCFVLDPGLSTTLRRKPDVKPRRRKE